MISITLLSVGSIALAGGALLGYYARQSIAKKRRGTIEAKLQKKITQTKQEVETLVSDARSKAGQIVSTAQKEREERRRELLKTEQLFFKREQALDQKASVFEEKEDLFDQKVQKLKAMKEKVDVLNEEAQGALERVSGLTKEQAKVELLKDIERDYSHDLMGRIQKLKQEGEDRFSGLAKEMIANAVQRYALSQAQDITTTTVSIPSDEIKGRIIGKEGRNIKALERLTGVEIVVDDSPETVLITGFNPLRRHIAKVALTRLIKDGRIQPAKIEEQVKKTEEEVQVQIKEFGEKAAYDTGVIGLPPKIIELLGRLYFRTSYGQNVLLHSIEVAHLSAALAEEIGVDAKIARKAGLLHDIGKAVDHQVQGSHVDIGIKILEKFSQDQTIIDAMKSHHGDYEPASIEAVIVQAADQISGARPGARKDTVENYLKRLKELEDLALSFKGVNTAYAISAGREIRVFVKPEDIGDLEAYKLARDIADKVQQELNYPGEIKVNLIRETRVVEYAK